jgi:hypothetical protein
MEFCELELKYSVLLFGPQILGSKIELGKPTFCILTKLRIGLPRNDDSIRDSGEDYFSYLKLPDCLWDKLQSIQACG